MNLQTTMEFGFSPTKFNVFPQSRLKVYLIEFRVLGLHLFFLIFGVEEGFQSIVYIGKYFEHKSYLLFAILFDITIQKLFFHYCKNMLF
jgi:hypothetical protein